MSIEQISQTEPRIAAALEELQSMIQQRYPQASFQVSHGEDPDGIYLDAVVDVADTDEVFDVVVDRLLEMQVDERLPIYVIPTRPAERVLQETQGEQATKPHWARRSSPEAERDPAPFSATTTTTRRTGSRTSRRESTNSRGLGLASDQAKSQVDEIKVGRTRLARDLSEGITVRLDQETLRTLRERAQAQGIGPTTLIRMWVLDRLHQSDSPGMIR